MTATPPASSTSASSERHHAPRTDPETCQARRRGCGSANGWRKGGRCWRCRRAHNAETNRYRGLKPDQRVQVLALLRSGKSREEAAESIGTNARELAAASARDSELRAALDGMPPEAQAVARRADFLHALVIHDGNRTAAARELGMDTGEARAWRRDPLYAAAEDAFLAWGEGARTIRPHGRITEAMLKQATEALEQGATVKQASATIGAWPSSLRYHARENPRLATALRLARKSRKRPAPEVEPEVEAELRRLWANNTVPASDIARRLNLDPTALHSMREHLDLPPRKGVWQGKEKLKPNVEAEVRQLWADGLTIGVIATWLDVSKGTVTRWKYALELPPRQKKRRTNDGLTPEVETELRRLWADPDMKTISAIAAKLGISLVTLGQYRNRLRLPSRTTAMLHAGSEPPEEASSTDTRQAPRGSRSKGEAATA